MKIFYFGTADELSFLMIEKLAKEDFEICFLSDRDFLKNKKPKLPYSFYKFSQNIQTLNEIIYDVKPEIFIFSGLNYLQQKFFMTEDKSIYVNSLTVLLDLCSKNNVKKFMYFSSDDVYGNAVNNIDEENIICPISEKGTLLCQGEYMVSTYCKNNKMENIILRFSDIFSTYIDKERSGFLGNIYKEIEENNFMSQCDCFLFPLNCTDVCEAVRKAISCNLAGIYNVCASKGVLKSEIIKIVRKQNKLGVAVKLEKAEPRAVKNSLFKMKTEWTNFYNIEDVLEQNKLVVEDKLAEQENIGKRKRNLGFFRKTLENIFIFLLFFAFSYLGAGNALFSSIDWMVIYIIVIAIYLGTYQSALAIVLAAMVFLWKEELPLLQMTNFYSYVKSVLKIVEYIFMGGLISYTIEMLREENRSLNNELQIKEEDLKEIAELNNKNVIVKHEYEKRLLNSKDSLTQLYHIISKLNVLEVNRILMETLKVVAEVMNTDTVAIYRAAKNSPFLRLSGALDDKSIYGGKTWNLEKTQHIYDKVRAGDIFVGSAWEDEPALVAPIFEKGNMIALIAIKNMQFENKSLHQINLLRTLCILISDVLVKALDHELSIKDRIYIKDSEIMISEEFAKRLLFAKEKQENNLGEYCLLQIDDTDGYMEAYKKVEKLFRTMDVIGLSEENKLLVLLNNSTEEEGQMVVKRLESKQVKAKFID